MNAKDLRLAGLLWPQTLTDEELSQEFNFCSIRPDTHPISLRMLREELTRRQHGSQDPGQSLHRT